MQVAKCLSAQLRPRLHGLPCTCKCAPHGSSGGVSAGSRRGWCSRVQEKMQLEIHRVGAGLIVLCGSWHEEVTGHAAARCSYVRDTSFDKCFLLRAGPGGVEG